MQFLMQIIIQMMIRTLELKFLIFTHYKVNL